MRFDGRRHAVGRLGLGHAFGPKQVLTPSDASDVGAPPYTMRDNPNSLLDVTELRTVTGLPADVGQIINRYQPIDGLLG